MAKRTEEKQHPEYAQLINALRQRPVWMKYETIAELADVSVSWLTQFAAGKIGDASFNRVMRVRDAMRKLAQDAAYAAKVDA